MKKLKMIFMIVLGVILLDTWQAFVFDNNPIIKIREYYRDSEVKYVDRGLLVDTYCGINGIKDTTIKGFSYSLSYDSNYNIIDNSKDKDCDSMLEKIYEDDEYIYYFSCIKSEYVDVVYSNGRKENIKDALKLGHIDIQVLSKFDIDYIKEEK